MAPGPPAAPPADNWQSITDFSPGIHQRLSSSYPPGTASELNTYRCYSTDGGALHPLPMKLSRIINKEPPVPAPDNQASEFRITGIHLANPLFNPRDPSPGVDQDNSEIFLGTEWWVDDILHLDVARYRRHFANAPSWQTIWTSPGDAIAYDDRIRPRHACFGTQRSNYLAANDTFSTSGSEIITHGGAPSTSGPTVVGWVVNGFARYFPDDANPAALSTVALPGDRESNQMGLLSPDSLVMHQGRAVIMPLTLEPFGPDSIYTHNEAMYWTQYNNLRVMEPYVRRYQPQGSTDPEIYDPAYTSITIGPENPNGYGVYASLTANELLLIKCRGGGLLIQGDVAGVGPDSPTARTLPYLRSPGLSMNIGTYCALGYMYVCDGGGAWLWQGGDMSQHLTKHMAPEFWRPPPVDLSGNENAWGHQWSQCDSANQFVLLPNNYLWDTDTNGWWRTDDPDYFTAHRWAVDWRSRFAYATPSGFRNIDDPAVMEYNMTAGASSYSWQSQPLATTIDSTVALTEVAVVCTGLGTVKVTAFSYEDPLGQTRLFRADDPINPRVSRQAFGVRGSHLTFRIESESSNTVDPAPSVQELRFLTGVPTPIGR